LFHEKPPLRIPQDDQKLVYLVLPSLVSQFPVVRHPGHRETLPTVPGFVQGYLGISQPHARFPECVDVAKKPPMTGVAGQTILACRSIEEFGRTDAPVSYLPA